MKTSIMQSKNDDRQELMLLVSRMQALVRGTLLRRSLMKLRAEFEEINEELGGGVSTGVSTGWTAHTPCRPTFKSAKEDSDVLQRLAKKGWRKPHSSQPSEQSVSAVTDPESPQYSSDFQSRSSLSSVEAVRPSSFNSSLPSGSGSEGDQPDEQRHSENGIINSKGKSDLQFPVGPSKETTETTEPMLLEQTSNTRDHHKENSDDRKSLPSSKSDNEDELKGERESPAVSGYGAKSLPGETLKRVESERIRGSEDEDEGCDSDRGGRHSDKIMHRQSLNETDFTVVSSMEASSVRLSSSDDESISADAVAEDDPLDGVNVISNAYVLETLDKGESELSRLQQSYTNLEGLSASNPRNSTLAAAGDGRTERDDGHEFERKGQQEHIRLRSPMGQEELPQSSLLSSKADSSNLVPISSQSPNSEGQAVQHLPPDGEKSPENNQQASTTSCGAVGMDPNQSRQDSMQNDYPANDHDTSVAADMTSIWSTDLSNIDNEQAPQRDEAQLREMRNNTAMELLWIQQAIESRKNYLRLKSKMSCSERTDQ